MKILGVNIIYDEEGTLKEREERKNSYPVKKLRRLRMYEVTTEYDQYRKYCIVCSSWGVVKLHIRKIIDYWLRQRLLYFISNKCLILRETFHRLLRKE